MSEELKCIGYKMILITSWKYLSIEPQLNLPPTLDTGVSWRFHCCRESHTWSWAAPGPWSTAWSDNLWGLWSGPAWRPSCSCLQSTPCKGNNKDLGLEGEGFANFTWKTYPSWFVKWSGCVAGLLLVSTLRVTNTPRSFHPQGLTLVKIPVQTWREEKRCLKKG